MKRFLYHLTQTLTQRPRPGVGRSRMFSSPLLTRPQPLPSSSNTLGRRVVLGGILGLLGLETEKTEDDPITKSMKIAILSIQVTVLSTF